MDEDFPAFIEACRAGDNASWDLLRSLVLRYLRSRYTALAEDHDDIAQEVALNLKHGLLQFQGTSKYQFLNYLQTIIRNTKESFRRSPANRYADKSLDEPLFDDDPGVTRRDLLEDGSTRPDMAAELNDLYRKATSHLSIRDRQLLLYKLEEYTDHEIGEILGMTPGGVAATYSRIKGVLRTILLIMALIILCERKLSWMASL